MNAADKQSRGSVACMDGIRGYACLLVFVAHFAGIYAPYIYTPYSIFWILSKFGVIVFFMLSGYMMTYHYYTPNRARSGHWIAFFIRRSLRIYPAYIAFIYLSRFCSQYVETPFAPSQHILYYIFPLKFSFVSHLWSIPPELQFYLIFPLLCGWLAKLETPGLRFIAVGAIGMLFWMIEPSSYAIDLIGNLKYFLIGIAAALIHIHYPLSAYFAPKQLNYIALAILAALIAYLGLFYYIVYLPDIYASNLTAKQIIARIPYPMKVLTDEYLKCAAYITAGLFIFLPTAKGLANFLFTNKAIRHTGRISYSLYLIHPLIIVLCIWYFPTRSTEVYVVGVIASFLAAQLMYLCIEKPFIRLGQKLSSIIC